MSNAHAHWIKDQRTTWTCQVNGRFAPCLENYVWNCLWRSYQILKSDRVQGRPTPSSLCLGSLGPAVGILQPFFHGPPRSPPSMALSGQPGLSSGLWLTTALYQVRGLFAPAQEIAASFLHSHLSGSWGVKNAGTCPCGGLHRPSSFLKESDGSLCGCVGSL